MIDRRTFVKEASAAVGIAVVSVIAVGKSDQPYFKNPRKTVAEVLQVI